jgi:orotate phosphoribosyltransferase-like protein
MELTPELYWRAASIREPFAQLKMARQLRQRGATYRQLARLFDVSVSTAWLMVNTTVTYPQKGEEERP